MNRSSPSWVALCVVLLCTHGAEAEEPPAAVRWGAGAEAGVTLNQFETFGPWMGLGVLVGWRSTEGFHLRGELGPTYSAHTSAPKVLPYHDFSVDETNEDSRTVLSVPLTAIAAFRLFGSTFFDFGTALGPTWTNTNSTQCGERSELGVTWGFRAGPQVSFGDRKEYQIGLHAHALREPFGRCVNNGGTTDVPAPRFMTEDDFQLGFTGRFGLYFP